MPPRFNCEKSSKAHRSEIAALVLCCNFGVLKSGRMTIAGRCPSKPLDFSSVEFGQNSAPSTSGFPKAAI